MSTIDLDQLDAALVIRKNDRLELHLPKFAEDSGPDMNIVLVSAIGARIVRDKEWVEDLLDWFENQMEDRDDHADT